MLEHPIYDMLMRDLGHKLDESPWSPEMLELPVIVQPGQDDDDLPAYPLRHLVALLTPTQSLGIIGNGTAEPKVVVDA